MYRIPFATFFSWVCGLKSKPLSLHFIVFSQVIFIAVKQTEENSKALYSYLVQFSIAKQAISWWKTRITGFSWEHGIAIYSSKQ